MFRRVRAVDVVDEANVLDGATARKRSVIASFTSSPTGLPPPLPLRASLSLFTFSFGSIHPRSL